MSQRQEHFVIEIAKRTESHYDTRTEKRHPEDKGERNTNITHLLKRNDWTRTEQGRANSEIMQLHKMAANLNSDGVEFMIPMIPEIRRQLRARPPSHPQRAFLLASLANALMIKYGRSSSPHDIEESIKLFHEALQLFSPSHPYRSDCLGNLALALRYRYKRTGLQNDLEEGIQILMKDLELYPRGHPVRGLCLNNLALSLFDRYEQSGSKDDLERMVELHEEALMAHPPGHPIRSTSLNNLANVVGLRYDRSGAEDDLTRVIDLHSQALELCTFGHPDRSDSLNNLAISLMRHYERSGSDDDLQKIMKLLEESLTLRPPGHHRRSSSLDNLATAHKRRYDRFGSEDDLEKMILLYTEALALRPLGNPERVKTLNNLAFALNSRYDRFEAEEDIQKSIDLHSQALELSPPGHPHRSLSLNNLALALRSRYKRSGSKEDLEDQIKLHMQALELRPLGNPFRCASLDNLALVLRCRYNVNGEEDDLRKAIQLHRQALLLRPSGHVHRARSLTNLGIALMVLFDCHGLKCDLEESIRLLKESRVLYSPGHLDHVRVTADLANALWTWHERISPSNADEVFKLLREASEDVISPLQHTLECVRLWVQWASKIDHESLSDAYNRFIQFLRRYLTIGPTIKHQFEALVREADMLSFPMDAAAHAIEKGNFERAVELLDAGRSLLWSEMRRFRFREPMMHLDKLDEGLSKRFTLICSELREISTAEATYDALAKDGDVPDTDSFASISYDRLLPRKRKLLGDYEQVLDLIRKKPGMEHFLQDLPFEKLREAGKEGPVIIVSCSRKGCHAIIVFFDRSPSVVPLGDDFLEKASKTCNEYITARVTSQKSQDFNFDFALRPILQQLWDSVVSKVDGELKAAGVPKESRIWWCPTSFLSLLPLHGAGYGCTWLIDSYISSYTSSLKALIDSRQPSDPTMDESRSKAMPTILVVAQTESAGLLAAGPELGVMRNLGNLGPVLEFLDEEEATRDSVLERLLSHKWVHFICHGTTDLNPFDSKLHLFGGDSLSFSDIIKADLPDAQFAFLAACCTSEQPLSSLWDETLHLAGAMQSSGFRSVIGTMWEMVDGDGPRVAKQFYEEMLRVEEGSGAEQRYTRAARSLWKVTKRMRRKRVPLNRWVNFVHIGA